MRVLVSVLVLACAVGVVLGDDASRFDDRLRQYDLSVIVANGKKVGINAEREILRTIEQVVTTPAQGSPGVVPVLTSMVHTTLFVETLDEQHERIAWVIETVGASLEKAVSEADVEADAGEIVQAMASGAKSRIGEILSLWHRDVSARDGDRFIVPATPSGWRAQLETLGIDPVLLFLTPMDLAAVDPSSVPVDADERWAWVDEHTSFRFAAGRVSEGDQPVLMTKSTLSGSLVLVGRADGLVVWLPIDDEQLADLIEE